MNKYQEALNKAKENINCPEAIYNGAMDGASQKDIDLLQELVDKETPMKVERSTYKEVNNHLGLVECPRCKTTININPNDSAYMLSIYKKRCNCGQLLKWSEDNEISKI